MKKTKAFIFAFYLIINAVSFSQTADEIARDRYWSYRNRLKKYFIRVGSYPGYSIPLYEHDIGKGDNSYYNGSYTNGNGGNGGMVKFGDGPEAIGNYLILLSTEYKLLKLEGKSTKETLNEIYYALNAVNRLDENAEYYLSSNTSAPNKNGFIMRDDGPKNFYQIWLNEYYNATSDREDQLSYFTGDAHKSNESPGYVDQTNEMSQDHIIDLFTGFTFVSEMVDNIYVKPTSSDPGFYIVDEVKAITNRIMAYVTELQPILQADFFRAQIHEKIFKQEASQGWLDMGNGCAPGDIRKNWVITDPITGRLVERGPNLLMMAYPIATAAKRITGTDWNQVGVRRKHVDQPFDGYTCIPYDFTLGLQSNDILADLWNNYPMHPQLFDPNDADPDWYFTITINGVSANIKMEYSWIDALAAGINDNVVRDNAAYMALSAACISNTWSHGHIKQHATNFGMYNYDLMFSVLNNDNPLDSKAFYEGLLVSAPCDGPYNYDYPTPGTYDAFWNSSNVWVHPNYSENTPTTDQPGQGDHPGIDYMLLYNMYRLAFYNQISEKYSDDRSCPCVVNGKIKEITDASNLNLQNNGTIYRKFYFDKNISSYIKEYINKNLNISNSKHLTNATDLIICNNSILNVNDGGVLENQSTNFLNDSIKIVGRDGTQINIDINGTLDVANNTKVVIQKGASLKAINANSKIIVRTGGKLIIEPGAFLELNNGSKLIVEDGGQVIIQANLSNPNATVNGLLTYNQGAIIQLKGDNAVLEINGRLHIGDNAVFGFTYPGSNSGYIKFNRGAAWWDNWAPNNAHITCGTNARISLQGQSKTDKIIDISQINVAIPKNLAQFIMVKGLVEFNNYEARLETDRPTIISNSTFIKGVNVAQPFAGRGLLVFGQPTCIITKCDFKNLLYGVSGALFYSGTKLSGVNNCNFNDCGYSGIITYGGGASIINNNFLNNGEAISCIDVTANSLVSKNTIDLNTSVFPNTQAMGIVVRGPNIEFEIKQNDIHNQLWAVTGVNANLKLRCNDLQNNSVALVSNENSKVNMSDLLGGGYNNASNCEFAAKFIEAGSFEADLGFNNFQIIDSGPCIEYPESGHGPNITPAYTVCPTIMEGSLINFIDFNPTPPAHNYMLFAEQNFWRPLSSPTDEVENRQNKVRKIDLTDLNNPIIDSASIFTGNVLTDYNQITCPGNTSGNGIGNNHQRVHPLDDNSNSSIITTASFYNKKLQKALQFSLNKMDKMQNSNKVNQAADLFAEALKYNYTTPVKNTVDKYLLELAYQKLFTCVAQLAEWHRDSAVTFNPIPSSLQARFNDLHTICALRTGRKDITEKDYKEISDLILLDKAMIYRISDNRQSALSLVNAIIAGAPKATHLNMYESFRCFWSTEIEAINGNLSVDEALTQLNDCNKKYISLPPQPIANSSRTIKPKLESEIIYSNEYAIAVFPNPTSGKLSVAYSLSEFKNVTLEIYNAQGKSMSFYNLNPDERTINIDYLNLENGIYFYNIKGDEKTIMSKKLVVIK